MSEQSGLKRQQAAALQIAPLLADGAGWKTRVEAGEWDLAIMMRVKNNEKLADLITDKMLKLEGIEKTTTLIGFKAYSNYDLERMFSIGLD
ncbi:MAG: Lrp/AsnC ligand binding domain-containing protein [Candidatus Hydrogenedentes bacterium]|nr:Lrp/AsnC ligand binding domain-containing protein [Candidatus Hydrogenedentota bacterium]